MEHIKNQELTCEGGCEEHFGTVREVRVSGKDHIGHWTFNYCEAAIEEDRYRGFVVVDAEQETVSQ